MWDGGVTDIRHEKLSSVKILMDKIDYGTTPNFKRYRRIVIDLESGLYGLRNITRTCQNCVIFMLYISF
jgi:hypothetical protein